MTYKETAAKLAAYRRQIAELRENMRSAQASIEPEEVRDYEFATLHGKQQLSALFGNKDTLFIIHNMGTGCANGRVMPGVSVFKRSGGKIMRVADTAFTGGDDFCSVWHLFDLIPEGAAGWQPKFSYASRARSTSRGDAGRCGG
jgi:predicted dithiol-disulfide oxidoreductase (DUF899 family)